MYADLADDSFLDPDYIMLQNKFSAGVKPDQPFNLNELIQDENCISFERLPFKLKEVGDNLLFKNI